MSTPLFTHEFNTESYKGKASINLGLFIDGKFVSGSSNTTIDVIDPNNGKVITSVVEGNAKDVDAAVEVAERAYKTVWGLNIPGNERGRLIATLATLVEQNIDELAAIDSYNMGTSFNLMKRTMGVIVDHLRYYAGWADKIHGKTIETDEKKFAYSRHEPFGVVAQINPWNGPAAMMGMKLAPALAAGNTVVIKPSEMTPLSALRFCELINEAGFPPGVVNVVNGYGSTVGDAITAHPRIRKIAFTGSTLTGRKILENAAKSNLKPVTLELGGKSPNIIFEDADIEQAIKWSVNGVFFNQGQVCVAGTRIYVHESIYDKVLTGMSAAAQALKIGNAFDNDTFHGPQVSKAQFDRVMGYIDAGKKAGAKVHTGGEQHGTEGFFIKPTIFTDTAPEMSIVKEEIFGPVAVLIKFKDEADAIAQANDTTYGLAAAVHTKDINRAIRVAHALEAGVVWINNYLLGGPSLPFGGYKQSGIGREGGEYALAHYTQVKAVVANIGITL